MLKKKSPHKLKGWQPRYFRIRPPYHLEYFRTTNTNAVPAGEFDLRLAALVEDKGHILEYPY
jgi:hypothetical protein